MRNAWALPVIVGILALPSCGVLSSLEKTIGETGETIRQFREDYRTAKAAADTDKSGDTSGSEWLAWLLAGGGGSILAGVAEARRRIGVRNAASDARKTEAETRIAALEAKAG